MSTQQEFVEEYEDLCRKHGRYIDSPGTYGVQVYKIWGNFDNDFEETINNLFTDIGLE